MEWIDCSDKIKHSELGLKKDTRSSDHRKKPSSRDTYLDDSFGRVIWYIDPHMMFV